jgi:hypothetical protein
MAITTYAELQSAIADFLNRDDLASVIPTFVSLAEGNFQRQVRHWRMEARSSITLDAQFVDLPADWLETEKLTVSTASGPREIELISVSEMDDRRWNAGDTAGIPQVYAINAGQLELFPTPSESMTGSIVYVQKIPALSVSNTSNWLLANFPDAYLYGSLVHSAPYLQEDQRMTVWAALAQQAIDAVNFDSDRAKYSGSGLRMRVRAY